MSQIFLQQKPVKKVQYDIKGQYSRTLMAQHFCDQGSLLEAYHAVLALREVWESVLWDFQKSMPGSLGLPTFKDI